ncbi:MAG: S8/S53 family peptidase [Chloroflexi bacterium]|nr:S8/S53 family peptidase [Chloroflexota bacterium]
MPESSLTPRNFVPNQILFLLEQQISSANPEANQIVDFLRNTLQSIAKEDNHPAYRFKNFIFDKHTYFASPENDDTRPNSGVDLTHRQTPLELEKGERADFKPRPLSVIQAHLESEISDADLMQGIYALFEARGKGDYLAVDDKTHSALVAITPNWLMSGSPNEPPAPPDSGAGGGGPAGKPVPPQAPIPQFSNAWDANAPWNFHLSAAQPHTQQPLAVSQLQLQAIADLFNIPISNPPIPDDIQTVSEISYSMLNHTLQTRMEERPATPKTVKVVILDTAPPCEPPTKCGNPVPLSLTEAYQQWGVPGHNPLLRSLLEPQAGNGVVHKANGSKSFQSKTLTVTYYPPFDENGDPYDGVSWDLKRACQVALNHRDWVMDHGLFIAGIIHTLAPQVKIHLVEVLNAYGCGTLTSYLDGLSVALSKEHFDPLTETLVVNMSFTFPLALDPNHPTEWLREFHQPLRQRSNGQDSWGEDMQEFLNYLTLPMQYVLQGIARVGGSPPNSPLSKAFDMFKRTEEINHHGGVVVAAAGNNGNQNNPHPAACAPAAFSTVLGVAALNLDNQTLTDYSNNADIPPHDGVAVFGGENQAGNDDLSHPTKGLLGLYSGAYPAPSASTNTTGWARWAGTSFAAPIISGLLAEMLRQGRTVEEALTIMRFAFGEANGLPDRLQIHQGPIAKYRGLKGCIQIFLELWSKMWRGH